MQVSYMQLVCKEIGNLMRAGDMSAFNQMAAMYTIENAISKKEFTKKFAQLLEKSS